MSQTQTHDTIDLMNENTRLQAAVTAGTEAIDILFTMLIELDKNFYPSKSGKPWRALKLMNASVASVIKRAEDFVRTENRKVGL